MPNPDDFECVYPDIFPRNNPLNLNEYDELLHHYFCDIDFRIEVINEEIAEINNHLIIIDGRLDGHDADIAAINAALEIINDHLAIIDSTLALIDSRLGTLEDQMSDVLTRLGEINDALETLFHAIEQLEGSIDELTERIADVVAQLTNVSQIVNQINNKLTSGSAGQVLTSQGGSAYGWQDLPPAGQPVPDGIYVRNNASQLSFRDINEVLNFPDMTDLEIYHVVNNTATQLNSFEELTQYRTAGDLLTYIELLSPIRTYITNIDYLTSERMALRLLSQPVLDSQMRQYIFTGGLFARRRQIVLEGTVNWPVQDAFIVNTIASVDLGTPGAPDYGVALGFTGSVSFVSVTTAPSGFDTTKIMDIGSTETVTNRKYWVETHQTSDNHIWIDFKSAGGNYAAQGAFAGRVRFYGIIYT